MDIPENPIIQDDPADTLYNSRAILTTLQEFYCANDLAEREYEDISYTGLYWVLRCVDSALAFEEKRVIKK